MAVDRGRARAYAASAIAGGEPLRWFEELYKEAAEGDAAVPWADLRPNPHLVSWPLLDVGRPRSVLVVGCGYGDDAEWLAERGLPVTAFDIAPSAVAACRRRFPRSAVDYVVADLLNLPAEWAQERFDLVVEAYTIQVLPPNSAERAAAFGALAAVTAQDLLVIARGRHERDAPGSMPWPLTAGEMAKFEAYGLENIAFEDYFDPEEPAVRRFRATYRRVAGAGPGRQGPALE
jgi:SAM-dependent methyltransferase